MFKEKLYGLIVFYMVKKIKHLSLSDVIIYFVIKLFGEIHEVVAVVRRVGAFEIKN